MNIPNKDKIQNEINNNISYDNIKSKDRIYYRSDNEPNKEEINDNFDNSLYLFYIRKPKDNNIINKNIINLYLFNMYNVLFPDIKSNLKEKRKKNGSVKGSDILLEIKEMNKKKSILGDASQDKNEKNEFDEFNENEYKNEMIKDFNSIDENMCILYSIYQFLINQYTKTVYKLFNLKSNYYINK